MGRSGTFVYLRFKDVDGAIWYDWILFFSFFKIFYFIIYLFFTLQYCIGFAIHQHESAMRKFSSVQFSLSVVSDSLRPHGLQHARPPCPSPTPEFTQTHVHWVGDAIQPFHTLSSRSSPAFNLSQHQGFFKWVSSSHQAAKVLEFQVQHQSFQWM